MLRFWNRLIKMDNSRLTKRLFLFCHDNPDNNWCADIKEISELLNVVHIYESKSIFKIPEMYEKCKALMAIEWRESVLSKPKLRTYKEFKFDFCVERYVLNNIPKYKRSIFAQFRCGILPLHIETGRFVNIKDANSGNFRKMLINERICTLCNSGQTEDETHFVFYCTVYDYERNLLFDNCTRDNHTFHDMNQNAQLKYCMQNCWKYMLDYIINAWNERKRHMYI